MRLCIKSAGCGTRPENVLQRVTAGCIIEPDERRGGGKMDWNENGERDDFDRAVDYEVCSEIDREAGAGAAGKAAGTDAASVKKKSAADDVYPLSAKITAWLAFAFLVASFALLFSSVPYSVWWGLLSFICALVLVAVTLKLLNK